MEPPRGGGEVSEYKISSGKWKATVEAKTGEDAVIKALKRDAPKSLGMLIMIETKGKPDSYWGSDTAVQKAGFKLEDSQ